jgi:GNAT superfamily N-acetyltransferase
VTVRPIRPDDVPAVVGLVRELADYERALHEVRLTEDQLTERLFGDSPALFGHVADLDGQVVGMALEDLYVSPAHRGTGLGKELLRTLACLCVERGYSRLEWSVLDWNTPSIDFYRAAGAEPMDEWTVFRLTDDALTEFARNRRTA